MTGPIRTKVLRTIISHFTDNPAALHSRPTGAARQGRVADGLKPGYETAKRLADVVCACTFLLIAFPLYATIALMIWTHDRGPVIYWQWRVGRHGKPFRFLKFRSMVRDADALKADLAQSNEAHGPIFKMKVDPRVTRVGRVLRRYSLDELPQMIHVLTGEMSLVGPRPHLPSEIEQCPHYPLERLSVSPGLLCFREVTGRSEMSFDHWIATDLDYVRRRSVLVDMSILLKSIPAVLAARGAY